jgi:methionyl-tRNA synthetase
MAKPFYVTTPIYYVNDVPHIGHAYTTVVADALRRYQALRGRDARMLTGTDEHGLKIERVAKERGQSPQDFVDAMSIPFRTAWTPLHIEPTDFIRTTEARHKASVSELWKKVAARDFLYEGAYEDWYCVGCESFKTEKELLEGNVCPLHLKPAERLKENTFFFKLSQLEKPLLDFYERNPNFIQPETRRNEVLSFVKAGLRDLSVSRTSFKWGIPVPGHPDHVMYVWFDALANYLSALDGVDGSGKSLMRYWAPSADVIHIVGKDILRFHAVYWPAFLMAAGYTDAEMPTSVIAHGFLTIDGQKMSKSLRNAVDPKRLAAELGADVVRYTLLRAISFGQDGDFDHAALLERYNADLGKNLGNLLSRTLGLCVKLTEGRVPAPSEPTVLETELYEKVNTALTSVAASWDAIEPNFALETTWSISSLANQYVDRAAPWALAKSGETARIGTVLFTLLDLLSKLSILIAPAMPERSDAMRAQLGLLPVREIIGQDFWPTANGKPSEMQPNATLPPAVALFPTYDKEQVALLLAKLRPKIEEPSVTTTEEEGQRPSKTPDTQKSPGEVQPPPAPLPIDYDHFAAVDLRVGLIVTAERVPKKDKLLKLAVDVGEATQRTIIAGLALTFQPEALVGKRVVVVANLAPRDFGKGLISHGMLLAAGPSEALHLATAPDDVAPGARLK